MPFYEFFCPKCRLLLDYFSKRATLETPSCPHCAGPLERSVVRFSSARRAPGGPDDATGGPSAADFSARIAAARAAGGRKAVEVEIAAAAEGAGVAIDPAWREAAAQEACGEGGGGAQYDALVGEGVSPLADAFARSGRRPAAAGHHPEGAEECAVRRDPVLREMPPPPLPKRRPSPWS